MAEHVILKRKHSKACRARSAGWASPWWIPSPSPGDGLVHADAAGRRGGSARWLVLECNATNCRAVLWVREWSICDFAELKLRQQARKRRG